MSIFENIVIKDGISDLISNLPLFFFRGVGNVLILKSVDSCGYFSEGSQSVLFKRLFLVSSGTNLVTSKRSFVFLEVLNDSGSIEVEVG